MLSTSHLNQLTGITKCFNVQADNCSDIEVAVSSATNAVQTQFLNPNRCSSAAHNLNSAGISTGNTPRAQEYRSRHLSCLHIYSHKFPTLAVMRFERRVYELFS